MLGALTAEQAKAKANVENYLETRIKMRKPPIEAFIEPKEMTFENLLRTFIDTARLKRVQGIKDEELTIEEETDSLVKAHVRDYIIVIDLENQAILHDCADWNRVSPSKRFCKHIGKLLLSLGEEKASKILRRLFTEKKAWEFKPYSK
jgi:hypothetical protein